MKKQIVPEKVTYISELFLEAIQNRKKFLDAKFKEWTNCKTERCKAKIIIKLIQLESSHLAEGWILNQVILWMKDFQKCKGYLEEAFISKGERGLLTERQRENLARATFENFKVKKLTDKVGSQAKAIREIICQSDDDDLPDEPETALKQKLKRYRKNIDKRTLPFPYYGLDIIESGRGTDQHEIELYIFNQPIEIEGTVLFGNTKITFPLNKSE
jgi:hypothetical protein